MNVNINDSEEETIDCEAAEMREREIALSDGRYLIFYTFNRTEPDLDDV